jgi:hypothetical protein
MQKVKEEEESDSLVALRKGPGTRYLFVFFFARVLDQNAANNANFFKKAKLALGSLSPSFFVLDDSSNHGVIKYVCFLGVVANALQEGEVISWKNERRSINLRDLLLRPARHGSLAAHGVRARAKATEAGTEAGEASLLLLGCLCLLQIESRKADRTVVGATRGWAVGVGVGGVHGDAIGDVDALVVAVTELRLAGNVKATRAGGGDFVGRAVESLSSRSGRDMVVLLLLLALLLLVRLEVLLVFEGRRAHVGLLLRHVGLGLSGGEV